MNRNPISPRALADPQRETQRILSYLRAPESGTYLRNIEGIWRVSLRVLLAEDYTNRHPISYKGPDTPNRLRSLWSVFSSCGGKSTEVWHQPSGWAHRQALLTGVGETTVVSIIRRSRGGGVLLGVRTGGLSHSCGTGLSLSWGPSGQVAGSGPVVCIVVQHKGFPLAAA